MTSATARLARLDRTLRQAGFAPATAQHIEAGDLLAALRAQGIDVADWQQIAVYLAPIYCASESQQEHFPSLLERAWSESPLGPPVVPESPRSTFFLWRVWALPLVCLLLLAVPAGLGAYFWPNTVTGTTFLADGPKRSPCACRVELVSLHTFGLSSAPIEALADNSGHFSLRVSRAELPATLAATAPGYASEPMQISRLERTLPPLTLQKLPPIVDTGPQVHRDWQREREVTLVPETRHPFDAERRIEVAPWRVLYILLPAAAAAL
jgi:hypothetical protein